MGKSNILSLSKQRETLHHANMHWKSDCNINVVYACTMSVKLRVHNLNCRFYILFLVNNSFFKMTINCMQIEKKTQFDCRLSKPYFIIHVFYTKWKQIAWCYHEHFILNFSYSYDCNDRKGFSIFSSNKWFLSKLIKIWAKCIGVAKMCANLLLGWTNFNLK